MTRTYEGGSCQKSLGSSLPQSWKVRSKGWTAASAVLSALRLFPPNIMNSN